MVGMIIWEKEPLARVIGVALIAAVLTLTTQLMIAFLYPGLVNDINKFLIVEFSTYFIISLFTGLLTRGRKGEEQIIDAIKHANYIFVVTANDLDDTKSLDTKYWWFGGEKYWLEQFMDCVQEDLDDARVEIDFGDPDDARDEITEDE